MSFNRFQEMVGGAAEDAHGTPRAANNRRHGPPTSKIKPFFLTAFRLQPPSKQASTCNETTWEKAGICDSHPRDPRPMDPARGGLMARLRRQSAGDWTGTQFDQRQRVPLNGMSAGHQQPNPTMK